MRAVWPSCEGNDVLREVLLMETVRKYRVTILFLFISILLLSFFAPTKKVATVQTHWAMDTMVTITVYNDADVIHIQECFDEIDRLEELMSITRENSALYRLNRDGEAELDSETLQMLTDAVEIAEATGGTFDPSLLALKTLWHVDARKEGESLPTQEEIAQALLHCGYENVVIEGNHVSLQNGVGVDLGGILKGYAADRCAEILTNNGVEKAIINMGGNVRVLGGKEYTIGIGDPDGEASAISIKTQDKSVITSGDYQRYFELEGKRYHHIFSRETGAPAITDLRSATIIGEDGAMCDALATACFVMGSEQAVVWMKENAPELDYVFIVNDHTIIVSEGIRNSIELQNEEYTIR